MTVDVGPPPDDAGLVWLTQADARGLAPAEAALSYVMNLKLADPAEAPAFVDAHSPTGWDPPSWRRGWTSATRTASSCGARRRSW